MAIFGDKKKAEKKQARTMHARARKLVAGAEHDVIIAPWLSEKALIATEKGVYAFAIPKTASKADVAGAVKELYKVSPRAVRIVNTPGKRKALRTRQGFGKRPARRKAYVYLNAGDTIQFA